MKKNLVFTLLFAATATVAFAQISPAAPPASTGKPTTGKNYLKLYIGFDLAKRPFLELPDGEFTNFVFSEEYATQPFYAPAFVRESANGNFWEISAQTNAYAGRQEVYDFQDTLPFPPIVTLGTERKRFAQLQFDYNWLSFGDPSQKVRSYLGLFARASAQWAKFEPSTSANYPVAYWKTVVMPGFIPRILIRGGKRLQLDLSAPITLGYFGMTGSQYENPLLTSRQQRNSSFDLSMATLETQIRLGVAYSLNKPPSE